MYERDEDKFNKLIGHRLTGAGISDDKTTLVLELSGTHIATMETEGDCCSSSWVEHLTIPELGGTITAVISSNALPPHEPPDEDGYDVIEVYHKTIRTTKGELIIEYRNSSNGYYGGWMNGPVILPKPPSASSLHDALQ